MSNYYGEKQKTESFFANHVKLITFLTVVALFLLICGPIFVLNATKWFDIGDTRPQMTQRDLILLSDLNEEDGIPLDRVTRFACEESEEQSYIKVVLEVEPNYTVIVLANKNTHIITSCQLYNTKRDEVKDVLKDDIQGYFDYLSKFE